ncbi:ABC transporter permease [Stratiformator vulcanicus]|uniref:Macrolide export ATP-binding/permease protein MacB n=1 Tax=Stratiformator vulcanicus TaxID=2527980 RepID=A0A517QZH9_9PLAN|nr:ABC transporter permease [Stratiformator vulcanicus]QDT37041.1 Macrolide export ATP-binding/permease protein MacB [Stratiformator vulcanicus]
MSLFSIAIKSLRQRALASSLTGLSVALGVMLMVAVLLIAGVINRAFSQRSTAFDLIIGPKGSDTQLVLSTIYHIGAPVENLPFLYYKQLQENPLIEQAVPVAFGDVTQEGSFPIVGTVSRYFKLGYGPDRPYRIDGRGLRDSFDAVIGSTVARENGWKVGSKFKMVHGGADGHVHDEEFTIVGVLAPTGTPNDRVAFVQLNGFYLISGHEKPMEESINSWREFNGLEPFADGSPEMEAEIEKHGGRHDHSHHDHAHHDHGHDHGAHEEEVPDIQKEVTSILVKIGSPTGGATAAVPIFAAQLNSGYKVQAVNPIRPIARIQRQIVGNVRNGLLALTVVILIVSGVGIFVSIYNSMSERLREIAIMRALGARRETVFSIILIESLLLCVGGGLVGLALGHALVVAAASKISDMTDLLIDPLAFDPLELYIIPALVVIAVLAGFLPGLRAYQADVADSLME